MTCSALDHLPPFVADRVKTCANKKKDSYVFDFSVFGTEFLKIERGFNLEAHNLKKTWKTNISNIEFGIRNKRATLFCSTSINYESIPIASYINKWRFTFKIYDHIMVSDTKTTSLALKDRSVRSCTRNKIIVKFYEKCFLCSTGYSILVFEDICRLFYYVCKYCFIAFNWF